MTRLRTVLPPPDETPLVADDDAPLHNWLTTAEQQVVRDQARTRLNNPDRREQRRGILAIVGLEMGLRISELAMLRLEHFDTLNKRCRVVRLKKRNAPGYKKGVPHSGKITQIVPITRRMVGLIDRLRSEWERPDGALFVNARITYRDKPAKARTLRKDWACFLDDVGLPGRGTHALRRTFATEVADRTNSVLDVNQALGHSPKSVEVDMIYIRQNPKRLERAMEMLYEEEQPA